MNKLLRSALFILSMLSASLAAQTSTAKWQSQPIVIDGDGSEWGMLPRFFNSESNLKYEFRNDGQNLYFILKAGDRSTQMQLFMAGFSIRFKLKTATALKAEIAFQPNKFTELPPMNTQEVRTDRLLDKSVTRPVIIPKDTAKLDGFEFTNGILSSENKSTICFARSKSNKDLAAYEIQIPLQELFGKNYQIEKIATIPIQLQVVVNDLSQSEIHKMRGRMGGMHGGRGMAGRGMQGGAEMGAEMQGGMSQLPGGEMNAEMPTEMRGGFSMDRKSFNKDFLLSSGK